MASTSPSSPGPASAPQKEDPQLPVNPSVGAKNPKPCDGADCQEHYRLQAVDFSERFLAKAKALKQANKELKEEVKNLKKEVKGKGKATSADDDAETPPAWQTNTIADKDEHIRELVKSLQDFESREIAWKEQMAEYEDDRNAAREEIDSIRKVNEEYKKKVEMLSNISVIQQQQQSQVESAKQKGQKSILSGEMAFHKLFNCSRAFWAEQIDDIKISKDDCMREQQLLDNTSHELRGVVDSLTKSLNPSKDDENIMKHINSTERFFNTRLNSVSYLSKETYTSLEKIDANVKSGMERLADFGMAVQKLHNFTDFRDLKALVATSSSSATSATSTAKAGSSKLSAPPLSTESQGASLRSSKWASDASKASAEPPSKGSKVGPPASEQPPTKVSSEVHTKVAPEPVSQTAGVLELVHESSSKKPVVNLGGTAQKATPKLVETTSPFHQVKKPSAVVSDPQPREAKPAPRYSQVAGKETKGKPSKDSLSLAPESGSKNTTVLKTSSTKVSSAGTKTDTQDVPEWRRNQPAAPTQQPQTVTPGRQKGTGLGPKLTPGTFGKFTYEKAPKSTSEAPQSVKDDKTDNTKDTGTDDTKGKEEAVAPEKRLSWAESVAEEQGKIVQKQTSKEVEEKPKESKDPFANLKQR